MKIGYSRISTRTKYYLNHCVRKRWCEKIYEEVVSDAKAERPILNNLLKQLRPGDTLVVWKLDLGRSII